MKLKELARLLRSLKEMQQGQFPLLVPMGEWFSGSDEAKQNHFKQKLTRLSRDLGAIDLGIEWDDTNEMYVVYDLDSRKE